MICVANKRSFHKQPHTGEAVYIGRTMPGIPGSPLGNPFKPSDGSPEARAACIEQYRGWLMSQPQDGSAWHELRRLRQLAQQGDLHLLCWCAPLSCHGDTIKATLKAMMAGADWRYYPDACHECGDDLEVFTESTEEGFVFDGDPIRCVACGAAGCVNVIDDDCVRIERRKQ